MPKTRVTKKSRYQPGQGAPMRIPFKIGGRKSPKSAARMTTEELLEEFNRGGTRPRDKQKIRQVLQARGVDLSPKVETSKDDLQLEMG